MRNGVIGSFGNINVMAGVSSDFEFCFVSSCTDTPTPLEHFFMTFYDFDRGPSEVEGLTLSAQTAWYLNIGADVLYANDAGTLCEVREFPVYEGVTYTDFPIYAAPDELDDGAPDGTDWQTTTAKYGMCAKFGNGAGEGDTFYANYPCTEIAVESRGGNAYHFESTVRGFGCDNPTDPQDLTGVMEARLVMFEFDDTSCFDVASEVLGAYDAETGRLDSASLARETMA